MGRKHSSVGGRLSKKVALLAHIKGKTLTEVLEEAGVTHYVWDNGLAAQRGPRIAELVAVAGALEVNLYEMVHDDEGLITTPEDDVTFGDRVDGMLSTKGWDRDDLGVELGLHKNRLEAILDARNPGVKVVKRIAEALEVTVDELLA